MECESENDVFNENGKRKGQRKLYKRDVIKNARVKGECYINYKGNTVPAPDQGGDCK